MHDFYGTNIQTFGIIDKGICNKERIKPQKAGEMLACDIYNC